MELPTEKIICGVKHKIIYDNVLAHLKDKLCKTVSFVHPLGTVYIIGTYGYVSNGYNWLKFPMSKLEEIKSKKDI